MTTAAGECVRNEQGTACLPVAPDAARVDRGRPSFANPTRITNPWFPVGSLTQVLHLGHEGGKPLRVEVTRLPEARTITGTVDGPRGPVQGAALVEELLMDGTVEEKAFAPGHGEFRARAEDELVAVALAPPVDGAGGSPPSALAGLVPGARSVARAAAAGN